MVFSAIRGILLGAPPALLLLICPAESARAGTSVYRLNVLPGNFDPAKCSSQGCRRVMRPIFERLAGPGSSGE